MLPIPRPARSALQVTQRCAAAHSAALLTLVMVAEESFAEQFKNYDDLLSDRRVFDLPRSAAIGGISKHDMLSLYTDHFVKKGGACRNEYDVLMASAPRKKCPMCGESIVTALDHHAPKSTYFIHAVNPQNLVPICSRCNGEKMATMPNDLSKQFIHPYYDDYSQFTWMAVVFTATSPIDLQFECVPPASLDVGSAEKLRSHFKRLKLNELYTSNAIEKLIDLSSSFEQLLRRSDWPSVRLELEVMLDGVRRRPASWEFVLISSLLNQAWYIEGGFASI